MLPLVYIFTSLVLILLTTAFLRLLYILPRTNPTRPPPRPRGIPTHLLIVLGSGGHTAEMLSLLSTPRLDSKVYTHRSYVICSGDGFSAERAVEFEREIVCSGGKGNGDRRGDVGTEGEQGKGGGFSIHTVPRARRIHQGLLTTPFTSLQCLWACLHLLLNHPHGYPDLILTNGPATSLIVILAATILRYFAFLPFISRRSYSSGSGNEDENGNGSRSQGKMRTIYIESWARVKRPSLSGRIIVWCGLYDRVLVQWKGLEEKGWGEYRGVLVR